MIHEPRNHPTGPGRTPKSRAARILRGFGLLALGAMLAGCVEETPSVSVAPPKGVSAASAVESFIIAVATADVIGDRCGAAGIRKGFSSVDALVDSYTRNLVRAGYSEEELVRAVDGLSYDRVGEKAVARLKSQGVREGDTASLCRYGVNEIAAGSAVGRLLRISG
jgi:uncharacterized protein (DUF849 family)